MKRLVLAAALLAAAAPAHALTIAQDTDIAGARAAFGGTIVLDWDLGGAPGSASGSINIQNWKNGTGFEGDDLAINGAENVTWTFAAPVTRIGFAIATGLEEVIAGQTDHNGAVFQLATNTGDTGTLTLIDPGSGYQAWVVIASATPFTSLSFIEPSGNIFDQYWGDVSAAAVPEPATWATMIAGIGLAGGALRRRRAATAAFA